MKTFQTKISKTRIDLLKQLNALKKLEKTEENKNLVTQKKQEIKADIESSRTIGTRGQTTGTDGPFTVYFKSFEGEIYWAKGPTSGKNLSVTIVFSKFEGELFFQWDPYVISTKLSQTQAEELFSELFVDENIDAYRCGFSSAEIYANDNSTNYPELFDNEDDIFNNLGIGNNKSFFVSDGSFMNYFVENAEDIIKGQEVVVFNNFEDILLAKIRWDINKKSTIWKWLFFIVLIILSVNILIQARNFYNR